MSAREQEQAALAAIWKRGLAEGGATIVLDTPPNAMRLRFQLYNLAKVVRATGDTARFSDELIDACENCICRVKGTVLTIERRELGASIASALAQLGIEGAELETDAERAAREALERLMGASGGES